MIRDVYAPSNYSSVDQDPSKSAEEKLEIISSARPVVIANKWVNAFKVTLPFVHGASAEIFEEEPNLRRDPNILLLHDLNVGDKELYGHGIGARLLKATVKYGTLVNPRLNTVRAVNADLGLVNVLAKCFGEKNVGVALSVYDHYGHGSDKSLEHMFDAQPPQDGEPYKVWEVQAQIDSSLVKEWASPETAKAK